MMRMMMSDDVVVMMLMGHMSSSPNSVQLGGQLIYFSGVVEWCLVVVCLGMGTKENWIALTHYFLFTMSPPTNR